MVCTLGSHAVALGLSAFAYVYARRRAHDERFSLRTGKVNALAGFTGAILLVGFALVAPRMKIARLTRTTICGPPTCTYWPMR